MLKRARPGEEMASYHAASAFILSAAFVSYRDPMARALVVVCLPAVLGDDVKREDGAEGQRAGWI